METEACPHPKERVKMDLIIPYGGLQDHKFFICLKCGRHVKPIIYEDLSTGCPLLSKDEK